MGTFMFFVWFSGFIFILCWLYMTRDCDDAKDAMNIYDEFGNAGLLVMSIVIIIYAACSWALFIYLKLIYKQKVNGSRKT